MKKTLLIIAGGVGLIGAVATSQNISAQNTSQPASAGNDWSYHQGDPGGSRFSTLTQINTSNVRNLKRAWVFKTGSGRFSSSPMVVNGVMYFSVPTGVLALDAATGQQIWKYAPTPAELGAPAGGGRGGRGGGDEGDPPAARGGGGGGNQAAPGGAGSVRPGGDGGRGGAQAIGTSVRGPAYWPGANGAGPRIYSSTNAGLAAIDARTGQLVPTFGENGILRGVRSNSPAVIYRNLIILNGGTEPGKGGTVKGFEVLTGKHVWTFYLKAQTGDPNRATWLNGSADTEASPGLWGVFTVDEQRGTVFIPVEKVQGNGVNDYWGGGTPGSLLYSDSLVALDAATGKMKWFQQLVHHDIWDYDFSAAPTLIEVRRNNQVIPAVATMNKMALMFIFHRETGEPIFGVEERPVPQTTVPGEWTSPTQPFPVKPPPLSRNSMKRSELSKVTPEHQKYCEDLWDSNKLTDTVPYQPWKVGDNTLVFPGAQGGGNVWGSSFNKQLGLIITNTHTMGQWGHLELIPNSNPISYRKVPGPYFRFWNNETTWSCNEGPWGELIAVNANTGDIAWRVPLGAFPELEAKGIKSGTPNSGGTITTAGNLVFIGATLDGKIRAFDARNGAELWSDTLPAPSQSTPTTYMGRDGKQYVVIGANGGGYFGARTSDEVIAYSLP